MYISPFVTFKGILFVMTVPSPSIIHVNIIILSPSNPEKHLKYAEEVFKYGKNTYIDKTFAENYEQAEAIFKTAEKYGAKFFSASALRYATETDGMENSVNIITTGGGSNIEEYIIHQIESVVKIAGSSPEDISVRKMGMHYFCDVVFTNDNKATMIYSPSMPFTVCVGIDGKSVYKELKSDYFKGLIRDILRFLNWENPLLI